MIVFQPCIILTNSLVGECEEDDPDPPEVTKHSKHDVAPICRTDIFPVNIPGVASSCQDSSASIYLGNQGGNIFMVEDLLMGAGWRWNMIGSLVSNPVLPSAQTSSLSLRQFLLSIDKSWLLAWVEFYEGHRLMAHFYPTSVLVFFPSLRDLIAFLQLHGHHRDQELQRGRPGSGVEWRLPKEVTGDLGIGGYGVTAGQG